MAARSRDEPAPLTEWAGITEPMTVFTNVALGLFAMWLAARLGYASAAEGKGAGFALEETRDELPNIGYATVFPVATIAKILLAQLILTLLM